MARKAASLPPKGATSARRRPTSADLPAAGAQAQPDAPGAKGGRPRKEIEAVDLPKIEALAGYGLSEEKIAHVLGMDADTFSKRKREDPAVFRALEKGRAMAESLIGQTLFNKAKGGDLGAIVWWEKTRAGRVDSSQIRHTGADGVGPVQVESLSPLERANRVEALLATAKHRANGNGRHP